MDAQAEAILQNKELEQEQIRDIVSDYGELRRRWRYHPLKRSKR